MSEFNLAREWVRVSLGAPFIQALCHIEAKSFVNYYVKIQPLKSKMQVLKSTYLTKEKNVQQLNRIFSSPSSI